MPVGGCGTHVPEALEVVDALHTVDVTELCVGVDQVVDVPLHLVLEDLPVVSVVVPPVQLAPPRHMP